MDWNELIWIVLSNPGIGSDNAKWTRMVSSFGYWIALALKDLGHFWFGYIRILGHQQMGAHLSNFEGL